jgi:hypothetical protein
MNRFIQSLRYRRLRPDQRLAWKLTLINASRDEGLARIIASLNRALAQPNLEQVQRHIEQLQGFRRLQRDLADMLPVLSIGLDRTVAEPQRLVTPVYCVSSMMLHDCHPYLVQRMQATGREPEWMLALTGLRIGNLLTLEHRLELKLDVQSAACASTDMRDLTRLLIQLSEFGQALHAVFHSHRFNGPPRPSATDMSLQEKLEQARYPAIQAVFSEDGYVRFFAKHRPFEVLIYGKGVEKVDRYLYRLQQIGQVGHT